MTALPLALAIPVAQFERRNAKGAFGAVVLQDADMNKTIPELLDRLLSGLADV